MADDKKPAPAKQPKPMTPEEAARHNAGQDPEAAKRANELADKATPKEGGK